MPDDHEFLLVAAAEHSPADNMRFIRDPSAIYIPDDVHEAVGRSFDAIPTLNPATGVMGRGLNFHGPPATLVKGAAIAEKVFRGLGFVQILGKRERDDEEGTRHVSPSRGAIR